MATHPVFDTSKRNISRSLPDIESSKKLSDLKINVSPLDDSGLYDLAGRVENIPSLQEDPIPRRNGTESLRSRGMDEGTYTPMHDITTSDPNDPLYDEIVNEDGNADGGDNHVARGFGQEDQNSEDSTTHQRRVEPIMPVKTAIPYSPDQPKEADILDDKDDVTHISEVYDFVPDDQSMVKNRAYSSNETKNKKLRSCMHSCCAQLLCFAVIFIVAGAAAVLSVCTMSENIALREQLLQRNQMSLTAEDWERIREMIALESSHTVIESLSPLRELNSSLASLSVQVDTLEEQQVMNTQTIDEQKMTLLELNERSTHFHNETEFQFAGLTTELNENKARDQVLQEEVNSIAVKVSEVTEQLNYTQEQANELNSTVHQLTEQVNQTRRAFEQLELQVTRDIGRLRLDINEVQTTLGSLESRLAQEVKVLEAAINRTETQVRTDVDALSNQTQEKITSLEQGVDLTKERLLNQTQEIRSELSRELFEMRLDLNQTEERLTANIASVNSTLEEFALVGQESFTNLSVALSTHRDSSGRDLQVVHANLSEQISINKADIRTQSENLISSERKLTAELAQLSLQSRNNFTQLEESLSNTNQDVSNVREDVQRVEGRMGDLESSQQHTSSDLRSLHFQLNYTQEQANELLKAIHVNLTEQISINQANIRTQSENLTRSERKLTAELAQLSLQTRNNFTQLEKSLSNTNQDVSNVREDVQRVEGRMGDLESSQQHTSSDLRSLRFQVEQFHSTNNAAMSVSSTSWICLGAIVSVLMIGL